MKCHNATIDSMGDSAVILEQGSKILDKDLVVAPGLSSVDIRSGFDRFRVICGYPRVTDLATFTAGAEPKKRGQNILKLVGQVLDLFREDPDQLIKIVHESPGDAELINQISILAEPEIPNSPLIQITDADLGQQFVLDLTGLLADEIKLRSTPESDPALSLEVIPDLAHDRSERMGRLINALGISPDSLVWDGEQIDLLVTLLESYTEGLSVLQNFKQQEHVLRQYGDKYTNFTAAMLNKLHMQHGADCVLESCHNVTQAAKSSERSVFQKYQYRKLEIIFLLLREDMIMVDFIVEKAILFLNYSKVMGMESTVSFCG